MFDIIIIDDSRLPASIPTQTVTINNPINVTINSGESLSPADIPVSLDSLFHKSKDLKALIIGMS